MIRLMLAIAAGVLFFNSAALAAAENPTEQQLKDGKAEFRAARDKARDGLLADLKKKQDAAQKAGDLKTLEMVQAETDAFADREELPKSVPTKAYERKMQLARARMEEAFAAAVKAYTKDGKIAQAKAVQQELDDFAKSGPPVIVTRPDPLKPNSIWMSQSPKFTLLIIERKGETFHGLVEMGDKIQRDVRGTIKDGRITWLAKDVRAIKGGAGGDNFGTVVSDASGDKIDFVWRSGKDSGTYTLWPPGKEGK